jgi:3-methyl-2-oxobutanoate hydroxymethyltransferase
MSIYRERKSLTVRDLRRMKASGEKIACLTAYDASFAALMDDAGADLLLVGDSLGMVIQGRETTLSADMDAMVYHTRLVNRGRARAFLVADMPFMTYANADMALTNAARLLRDGGAEMVKLETGPQQAGIVQALSEHGIPVCAHLGLMPQGIHKLGGYLRQGEGEDEARRMRARANDLQSAGADMLLLECVPQVLASEIALALEIPVMRRSRLRRPDTGVVRRSGHYASSPVVCAEFPRGTGRYR